MKASDRQLAAGAGLVAVDTVAVGIDAALGGAPFASGAWGLAKVLLGKGLALRQKKALEWVEMVRDNPSIFTKGLLLTEEFQDAFVIALESYIKERDADKRILLRAIFKDYSSAKNAQTYPLERLNEITRQLTIADARNFSYLVKLSKDLKPTASFEDTRQAPETIESVLHLVSLGLLVQDTTPRYIAEHAGLNSPRVWISMLGAHYYKFIDEAASQSEEFAP